MVFNAYTCNIKSVDFYPYRTARAFPIVAEIGYERGDEVDRFRIALAELSKTKMDNHTVYHVHYEDGAYYHNQSICFWFSDWKMYIGLKLDKKDW